MKGLVMSSSMKKQVRAYWAGLLAQHEVFRSMLRATDVELIERRLCDDTPDALFNVSYRDGGFEKLWCEITGAWRSREEAQEVVKAAEEKRERSTESHGLMRKPDLCTANSVLVAIMLKLEKDSCRELMSEYGLGHLHVYIASDHYPLFSNRTLSCILDWIPVEDLKEQSIFRSLSLGYRDEVYCLWENSRLLDPTS